MTCEMTMELGVFVLGALGPAERAAVEAHLCECAICREELRELSGLPAMLDRLGIDDIESMPAVPPADLYDRIAAEAMADDGRRRTTRGRRLLAVAAALVVLVGGGIGGWAALRTHHHASSGFSVQAGQVSMRVAVTEQADGTAFRVDVSGLPADEHCRLIAVARDGSRELAGAWSATYSGEAQVTGSTTIPRDQLSSLVLLGTHGAKLAVLPL